jgi:alpha-glucosidase
MLLLTLRGTPTLYYGDELGLEDVAIPPDRVQDPWERNEPGLGLGRDPARTPMPWDGSPNAGFTTGTPWLPLHEDWPARNVAAQAADPRSMLALHRRLIALRRERPALHAGTIAGLHAEGDVLMFERRRGAERLLVALNLGRAPQRLHLAAPGRVLLSTHMDRDAAIGGILELRASEGMVLELSAP